MSCPHTTVTQMPLGSVQGPLHRVTLHLGNNLVNAIYFTRLSVSWFAVVACLLYGSGVGCRRAPSQASSSRATALTLTGAPTATASASAATPDALPPLSNVAWIEPLHMADGNLAYVTPPVGAREPRPLMVAVHGAGDRPEWACGGWRLGASEYPFVVCPQGLKFDSQRFAWDSPSTIARRVQAAIDAARARFGPYIADGPTIYAGVVHPFTSTANPGSDHL